MPGLLDVPGRVWQWFGRLPPLWTGLVVAVVVGAVAGAGVSLYRTYDYVQHDNDFCMSCHLMADPFERFARSAHRGLGCKACHQPTFAARSQMALTQILEQPEELGVHAEVPNARCTECHVEGDPEEWTLIANSVGHRVHLESDDPSLEGVQCVKCHSSSVHEFAATDRTCGQAGCHEDTEIRLGDMADLTIHCATCHDFTRPIVAQVPAETLVVALRPQREECLSCHAMRTMLAGFPEDDPHDGVCGACHNPHTQATPAEAVTACLDCHARPDTVTPFHRGLDPGVLDDCILCHQAHDFEVQGRECMDCHQDIFTDSANGGGVTRRAGAAVEPAGLLPALWRAQQVQDSVRFRHAQHRGVDCMECHAVETTHGGLKVTGIRSCRSCHHTDPVAARCARCHSMSEYARPYTVGQTVRFSVSPAPERRSITFDHAPHQAVACRDCHTGYLSLSAASVSCDDCHASHHRPEAQCIACHEKADDGAHGLSVHVSCAASGCHAAEAVPFEQVPMTRNACLVCHQELTDHRPGRNCAACHALPTSPAAPPETPPARPRASATGPPGASIFALQKHGMAHGERP